MLEVLVHHEPGLFKQTKNVRGIIMLSARDRSILKKLLSADTPVTGKYLASINQVSARTIREDIRQLDHMLLNNGAEIQAVMGKGYLLKIKKEKQFRKYLQTIAKEMSEEDFIPNTPEERVTYVIKRLLLSEDYVKLDKLAEALYVSKSTVQNDLKSVKEILSSYDIKLKSRPNHGLEVEGNELKLRFCMSEYVFGNEYKEIGDPMLHTQLKDITKQDLDTIQEIIMDQLYVNKLSMSDIAVNNLQIHICIAINRIKRGAYVTLFERDLDEILDKEEYVVARKIVNNIKEKFNVEFPDVEIAYIAIHLLGTKMTAYSKENNDLISVFLDESILNLVQYMLEKMERQLNLGICEDEELKMALALHLKPAINRYKYGMNIRNPLLESIKKNYPLSYEAAVISGVAIEEMTGSKIDDNETGYLALHIGAAIERKKMNNGPKRCLIVCASGFGTAKLIFYKLKRYFGEFLDVVGTTEYYKLKDYDLRNTHFIISSIPIPEKVAVPVIEVNALLNEEDIRKIHRHINLTKQQTVVYFQKDLLFLQEALHSKEEVLAFLNRKLLDKGLVEETFLEAVYEREAIATTAYGNLVAIPHPISPQSEKTFLAACTLEKAVMWDNKPVQFICMLCVKKKSMEDLQSLYDFLGNIIDNISIVQNLVKAETYEEFMRIL